MYAIIETGGKQYKVSEGETIFVEKLAGDVGSKLDFSEVLFVGGKGESKVGAPILSGVKVAGEIVEQGRDKKIKVFKKKRRKGYQKLQGHRQAFTGVKVTKITV